jgi:hypothetical protein
MRNLWQMEQEVLKIDFFSVVQIENSPPAIP